MHEQKGKRGRERQKLRTRSRILAAARELMQEDGRVTLEDIAEKADISRATMYRYFSNIDLLFSEATLDLEFKYPEEITSEMHGMGLRERILHIQDHHNDVAISHENAFRRYLSAVISESVIGKKNLRGGRRSKSLELALAPYRESLGEETFARLVSTATLLMGIDSVVSSKDVCQLGTAETLRTLRWAMEMVIAGVEVSQVGKEEAQDPSL